MLRGADGAWRGNRSDAGKPRPSKGISGRGKRACFLTTAACEERGLSDDCTELTTLRRFRDEVLHFSEAGHRLVEEYYEEAPGLVPLVRDSDESERVWRDIQATVAHIERGHHEEAIASHSSMFGRLRKKARCQLV